MSHRITVLAIREAAQAGDIDTLQTLLSQHNQMLNDLTAEEIREAYLVLDEACESLEKHKQDIQDELLNLRSREKGVRQYRSAA